MILDKAKVSLLSHVVSVNHQQLTHGFVRIHDVRTMPDVTSFFTLEDGPMVIVKGRNLKPRRDVRRLLFQLTDEVKGDTTAMIWHTYGWVDDISTLSIVMLGEE